MNKQKNLKSNFKFEKYKLTKINREDLCEKISNVPIKFFLSLLVLFEKFIFLVSILRFVG